MISKIGHVTKKDFGTVMKEFANDIITDYKKEHEVDDKEQAFIGKVVGTTAPTIVRNYFSSQA